VSTPFLGKLADSTGPRLCLSLAFILLLTGYFGIATVYDGSQGNTEPVGSGTLLTLVLFEFMTGIGSSAGYTAAFGTLVRSFPDHIVSSTSGSATLTVLNFLSNPEGDSDMHLPFWLRIITLLFLCDRTRVLSRKHFRSSTHSNHRDLLPNGAWLVSDASLPTPRTRRADEH
jgi:MFS family permease